MRFGVKQEVVEEELKKKTTSGDQREELDRQKILPTTLGWWQINDFCVPEKHVKNVTGEHCSNSRPRQGETLLPGDATSSQEASGHK